MFSVLRFAEGTSGTRPLADEDWTMVGAEGERADEEGDVTDFFAAGMVMAMSDNEAGFRSAGGEVVMGGLEGNREAGMVIAISDVG